MDLEITLTIKTLEDYIKLVMETSKIEEQIVNQNCKIKKLSSPLVAKKIEKEYEDKFVETMFSIVEFGEKYTVSEDNYWRRKAIERNRNISKIASFAYAMFIYTHEGISDETCVGFTQDGMLDRISKIENTTESMEFVIQYNNLLYPNGFCDAYYYRNTGELLEDILYDYSSKVEEMEENIGEANLKLRNLTSNLEKLIQQKKELESNMTSVTRG